MARTEFDSRRKKARLLDNSLTPAEIAGLIQAGEHADVTFELRSRLESGETPVSYVRQSWSEHAHFFTANRGARTLIVVFCGSGGRPGTSISYFLQCVRDDLYDILVLQDSNKLHFLDGIPGIGGFLDVVRKIDRFAEVAGYTEILTFGTSMGGYPALRAGILVGAARAISVSGSFIWPVGRLSRNEQAGCAFDVLCPCFSSASTELVAVVPEKNKRDVHSLQILQATFPKCVAVKIATDEHTIPAFFFRAHLLRLFYACLFDYWEDARLRSRLLTLVEEAAVHISHLQTQSSKNGEPHIQAMQESEESYRIRKKDLPGYASKPWRAIDPLRRVAKFIGAPRGLTGLWRHGH